MKKYCFHEDVIEPWPRTRPQQRPLDRAHQKMEDEGLIIPYWRDNAWRFPDLAPFAFDALSIPAMSREREMLFLEWSEI